ncbi:pirin family protein [Streptomyces sp. NPDC005438]|uniref:pirin family protein n=1 Tax=Streptomyces sp. NPDC005438 TaxID=3156880 RepID=UPI0033BA7BC0
MLQLWHAHQRYRGGDRAAGIDTRHAFSFSGSYAPDNLRWGPLVACNEERVAPGGGYDLHQHRDLEIVTWVLEGELEHRDSTGQRTVVRPGDVQRLYAGSGARHEERQYGEGPLRFLQMWLLPLHFGGEPEYEVVRGIADGTPFAPRQADALLHLRRLGAGQRLVLPEAPWTYVHLARGRLALDEGELDEGGAVRSRDEPRRELRALTEVECLVWELYAEPEFG